MKVSINFGSGGLLLTIVFLILKLTHVIDWAWLWIFSPIWIPLAICLAIVVLYYLIILIVAAISAIRGY